MKRIELGYLDTGEKVKLSKLAEKHYDSLINEKNGFISPETKLTDLLPNVNQDQQILINYLTNNLKELIIADPSQIKTFITHINSDHSTALTATFKEQLLDCFCYDSFRRSKRAYTFFSNLGLKACPYCNAQFIVGISRSKKVFCHFDHIYPKSEYPYLSVSFFNLVPCCSNCNQAKSDLDIQQIKDFVSPYEGDFHKYFKFKTTETAILNYCLKGRTNKTDENIVIEATVGKEESVGVHFDRFKIDEIIKEHHDIVDEMYWRSLIYSKSRIDELVQEYVVDLEIFESEEELLRAIHCNYLQEEDINKRPLSKLTQDLKKEFERLQMGV